MVDRKDADVIEGPDEAFVSLHSDSQSYIDEDKLLRKTDLHVVPILFLVYLAAFLDR